MKLLPARGSLCMSSAENSPQSQVETSFLVLLKPRFMQGKSDAAEGNTATFLDDKGFLRPHPPRLPLRVSMANSVFQVLFSAGL